jgi:Arginase family
MKPFCATVLLVALHWQALTSCAHRQYPFSDAVYSDTSVRRDPSSSETWHEKYGTQPDLAFTGPLAFSHLPYIRCLEDASPTFDIALLGMPFDTAVTYRPGARFGPQGIRVGSRRSLRGYSTWSLSWRLDPYQQGFKIIDCGDVSVTRVYIFISFLKTGSCFPRSLSARSIIHWRWTRWKSHIRHSCNVMYPIPILNVRSALHVRLRGTIENTQKLSRNVAIFPLHFS